MEIVSLVGFVSCNIRFHLHISISDSERNTKGGHLKDKNIMCTTAEIIIGELPKSSFSKLKILVRTGLNFVLGRIMKNKKNGD